MFSKSVQLFAYVNKINIIRRTKQKLTTSFDAIRRESAKIGLAVHKDKQPIKRFKIVNEFAYFGSAFTCNNNRKTLFKWCYHCFSRQLSSGNLARSSKFVLYSILMLFMSSKCFREIFYESFSKTY